MKLAWLVVMVLGCGAKGDEAKSKGSGATTTTTEPDGDVDDLRDRANDAAKQAKGALAKTKAAMQRVDNDLSEVGELIHAAETEIDKAQTDSDRVAARARLDVYREKLRTLEGKRDQITEEADKLIGGSVADRAIAKMDAFSKQMCRCQDKACADRVNEDMTKWGTEMARSSSSRRDDKPTPELARRAADIMTRYTECMTKVMMAGMGRPDPVKPDDLQRP